MTLHRILRLSIAALLVSAVGSFAGQAPATQDTTTTKKPTTTSTKPAPVANASAADIQAAKAAGQVWVNTDTGVYHKSGKWYGATKQGKFMTEQDAKKAGYHAAKNEK
jgi:hypothetical protein